MKRITEWIDWKIYWLFWKAVNRMVHRNPAYAYLMQLRIAEFLRNNPLDESLKRSTEVFHEAMSNAPNQRNPHAS